MATKGSDNKDQSNRVPMWNGHPEGFFHYVTEVKWYLAGTRQNERPLAAARLVRRLLESDYPALKSLMYKLDPMDFTDEDAVQEFLRFLEASPMNRQPIPDAGAKLSMYYRKLTRRHSESVPQFLVREDTAHDEMWRALQRLLRELDFSKFETSVEELKEFCGMRPGESVFMEGEDAESVISAASAHAGATEEESSAASAGKGKGKGLGTSTPTSSAAAGTAKAPKKRKDLIQRLMEKGLIPLAAMDIIRGWLVLEMSAANETEKALVKASAQNRLNYDNIRTALLTIHEDRGRFGGPKGVGAKSQNSYWQEAWRSDEHEQENEDAWWGEQGEDEWNLSDQYGYYQNDEWPADDPGESDAHQDQAEQEENPEVVQLMEEEKELQAMMAETQRSLDQARKAVAAAKKARGWSGPQQSAKSRPTSMAMKGKGTGHHMQWSDYGKGSGSPWKGPSSSGAGSWQSNMYFKGGKNSGWSFGGGKHKSKGKKSKPSAWMAEMYGLMEVFPEEKQEGQHAAMTTEHEFHQSEQGKRSPAKTKVTIDTGATVTAGGQEAVQDLVVALAKARPDMTVNVASDDRPWFRYGSGQWGRALFGVNSNCLGLPMTRARPVTQFKIIPNCCNSRIPNKTGTPGEGS